ncbi:MAG: DNA topoisomerase (ATP-hydrolyzing) [Clostridia bacterium]
MAKSKDKDLVVRPLGETIIQRGMADVMHECMMPYSEYVILERALPRVEDGLKPVQRRILFTMQELGLPPDKPHRKCARIVGDCLGKYHPHGDTSVYDALVRMAQPFLMRGMLVDGHGNFGSIDGDSAAAMRYTEARMTPLAMELLRDIDKDTVSFHLNFDDTQKEPDMLPGRYPNLLVNGASGIAVGLATNIPPHNLAEVIGGAIAQMDDPDITTEALMRYIPAPDFPTGGILLVDEELKTAYETGRGKLQLRAKVHTEQGSAGRTLLVITEMPYQVSKAQMLEKILRLSEEKKALLGGIYDIRDESDRTGMRAVIEVKRDADVEKTLAALYKYSDMQVTFGVNMVAIAGGKPVQMGIKTILGHFIRHQKDVVTRRSKFELEQAQARAHVLEGLIVAVDNLDEVIRLIRASKTPKEARTRLMERFALSEAQGQAILDMRLQRLTNLEIVSLKQEYEALSKVIARLQAILKSEKKLLDVIKGELSEIGEKYADARRTQLLDKPEPVVLVEEDAKVSEPCRVLFSRAGFIKRVQPKLYDKALLSSEGAEAPRWLIEAETGWKLLLFTDAGQCYPINVEQLPDMKMKERGLALGGLLAGIQKEEKLVAMIALADGGYAGELVFVSALGQVKRSALSDYAVRKARFAGISLKTGDKLAKVWRAEQLDSLLLVSEMGMAIHFALEEVPVTGRVTAGVRAIALAPGDRVIGAFQHNSEGSVLLATERGCFKRCLLVDFDRQTRGGKGLKAMAFQKNGANGGILVAALRVSAAQDLVVEQAGGTLTTISTDWVKLERRDGRGQPLVVAVLDDVVVDVSSV